MFDFDFFVIGAGSGGVRAARVAASFGAKVGIAEERYFGGTCVNVGCVPKKLFSYAAHYRDDFEDSRGFGWQAVEPAFDWSTLRNNKNNEINRLNGIYESLLESSEVTVFEDRARFTGPHSLQIGSATVTAEHILIAVGGWPQLPDIPGKELLWDSNEVFHLESLPESIAILGGGYIALEFASIYSRLGVQTTLVYRGNKLLRGFDEEIRDFIGTEVSRQVDLRLNEDFSQIERENNELRITLKTGDELRVSAAFAATGRRPLTADLGLEHVEVALSDYGAVLVDNRFETAQPGVYAVGDVIDRMQLTPVALAEGQWLATSLFGAQSGWSKSKQKQQASSQFAGRKLDSEVSYKNIATAVFCHPNVATVGLTEAEAVAEYGDVDIYSDSMRILKHTLSGSAERAFVKLVVDAKSQRVLGVHVAAPDAGELVQGFAVAINCGATKADFDRTIGIHPTLAEELVTMRSSRKGVAP